ncbi:MAG TPA: sterol desaturase family protein [Polaromonas sp.]|uniref:sterol desaturase family protein n=1 Tax=Polaromonas sp. TaxID=1869339 RepID=UPI002D5AEE43|nr:sterol desaturase family protein [Polaromonas sp.]HYW58819.1 sterol desaturase family protein [Polaromonas sp.]
MKFIISIGLLPGALLVSVGSFLYARSTGGNLEPAILLSSLGALGLAMLLERYMPHHAEWNAPRGDRLTDWLSFGLLAGVVQPVLKWLSPLAVVAVYGWLEPSGEWFGGDWPFLVQVLVVTLLSELGKYWVHRWHHTQTALWWLHALHHGSERLYSINNFRVHPLEYALKHALSMLPLMLLGAPAEVLLGYIALTQPVQMLQHVNLPLRHGWMNYVFSTNELHRWHHSTRPEEGNNNYGSALIVWDVVFGTFHYPRGATGPESIGLFATSKYPARRPYLAQVLSMFGPACCKA